MLAVSFAAELRRYAYKTNNQMGFLSQLFRRRISPKRYGQLLAEVVQSTLGSQFQDENVEDTQQHFRENGWEFKYNRYAFVTMSLYIRQAIRHATKHHPNNIEGVFGAFLDAIPEEYSDIGIDEDILAHIQLMASGNSDLTAARLAAEKYFGVEPELDQIMYFGASAKTFSSVLKSFEKEVNF